MKKILLLTALFVFAVSINLKAQCTIDGTWHSELSNKNFWVNYDAINDVIGVTDPSDGCVMYYDYDGINPYDGNVDYKCNYSSCYQGIGNVMEIYNSTQLVIGRVGAPLAHWDKTYSTWYSETSNTNISWDPSYFITINTQYNTNPLPTSSNYVNIVNSRTKPSYGHPPTTHIVKSN
jgi:hypothetical protein